MASAPLVLGSSLGLVQQSRMNRLQLSDCTGGNHLFSQMVLVLAYRAIPATNGLILTYHYVFCNLIQQS